MVGIIKRERPFDVVLNHWDETVAYAALFCLAHAVPARLRVQGASLDGLLARSHDLPAYGRRSPWGAIRFENLEAQVSYPYAV